MKKLLYLLLCTITICSITGCASAEEQNETEISVAQESSAGTLKEQDSETETGKEIASAGIETTETVTKQEMEEVTEKALTTVICKRQNTDMREYVFPETVELTEFEELSYRLLISWNMRHIDGGEIYWDYGILDKENNTWKKAVERYSQEMEEVMGYPEEIIWENTGEAHYKRLQRENMERITDISPDGQYYITYRNGVERGPWGVFTVTAEGSEMKIYHQNQCLKEVENDLFTWYGGGHRVNSAPFGIWIDVKGIYNLLEGTEEHYNLSGPEYIHCLNKDATLMASIDCDSGNVRLYDVKSRQCLYSFEQLYSPDDIFYIDGHQLVGDKDSGFILFEDQTSAYKLHYPSGEVELMGDYMFNPCMSPDGKYLFYTGPDAYFWEDYGWRSDNEEYCKIPNGGMYIKELQTGKTAYIDMDEDMSYDTVAVRWLEASDE